MIVTQPVKTLANCECICMTYFEDEMDLLCSTWLLEIHLKSIDFLDMISTHNLCFVQKEPAWHENSSSRNVSWVIYSGYQIVQGIWGTAHAILTRFHACFILTPLLQSHYWSHKQNRQVLVQWIKSPLPRTLCALGHVHTSGLCAITAAWAGPPFGSWAIF